ncbi:MAG: hypothetical protein AB1649_17225 [Chloroflexota bacterium]
MDNSSLPLTRNVSTSYTLSLIVALLIAVVSLIGLLFQASIYPIEELRHSFIATDVVNLVIVLPILLGSMTLARRGKLMGLLFWPGALFLVTYHYIAYSVAMPFTWQFVLYLTLVLLSIYTLYLLLLSMDAIAIQGWLRGKVPERFAGGVLTGFGLLFFVWRGVLVVQTLVGSAGLSQPELATGVADVLLAPAWIIGGVLLWRKQAFGYVTGAGLLFQFSMLFIGLFVYFALQPFLAGIPFPVDDFVAVFVMSLVCFIPFGLFVRGVFSADRKV